MTSPYTASAEQDRTIVEHYQIDGWKAGQRCAAKYRMSLDWSVICETCLTVLRPPAQPPYGYTEPYSEPNGHEIPPPSLQTLSAMGMIEIALWKKGYRFMFDPNYEELILYPPLTPMDGGMGANGFRVEVKDNNLVFAMLNAMWRAIPKEMR